MIVLIDLGFCLFFLFGFKMFVTDIFELCCSFDRAKNTQKIVFIKIKNFELRLRTNLFPWYVRNKEKTDVFCFDLFEEVRQSTMLEF